MRAKREKPGAERRDVFHLVNDGGAHQPEPEVFRVGIAVPCGGAGRHHRIGNNQSRSEASCWFSNELFNIFSIDDSIRFVKFINISLAGFTTLIEAKSPLFILANVFPVFAVAYLK